MAAFKHDHMDSLNRYREYKKFWDKHRIPGEVKDKRMLWTDPGYTPMFSHKKKNRNLSSNFRSVPSSPAKQSRNKRRDLSPTKISLSANGISSPEAKKKILQSTNQSHKFPHSTENGSKSVVFRVPRADQEKAPVLLNGNVKNEQEKPHINSSTRGNSVMKIVTSSAATSKLSNGQKESSSSSSSDDD